MWGFDYKIPAEQYRWRAVADLALFLVVTLVNWALGRGLFGSGFLAAAGATALYVGTIQLLVSVFDLCEIPLARDNARPRHRKRK